MKKKINISPVGLKGNQINERMKQLMGIGSINENKSNIVVELTKVGPDGKAYAIVRENHEWYIKTTDKKKGLVAEDFKYIGGLMNKKSEAYPSYAKAIKHLNLKFKSLAEAHNFEGEINVFENDNLLSESGMAGFSSEGGSGFSGKGNNEGQESLWEEETDDTESDDDGLTTEEAAIDKMIDEELVGNQDKLDMNKNGKLDSDDFSKLRTGKKGMEEMTDKEKSFAALAEPKDEITYADKIAGAKKEGLNENNEPYPVGTRFKDTRSGKINVIVNYDNRGNVFMSDESIPGRKFQWSADELTNMVDNGKAVKINPVNEHKLSILKAMNSMDAIIDSLTEGKVKKKVYTLK